MKLQETPLKKINGIYFKLEFLNPSGSVKDRGVLYQLQKGLELGIKEFTITSSGNAAISACYWAERLNLKVFVFVSEKINKKKLQKLKGYTNAEVILSKKPISDSLRHSKSNNTYYLRASTDPNGFFGYKSLAKELDLQMGRVGSIFIPTSSGTLSFGVMKGFEDLGYLPQLHVVQTTACNFIAKEFDKNFISSEKSIADALVAKTSMLKSDLSILIKESKGSGWIVEDSEILEAWDYLKNNAITSSYEGAATLAAVNKANLKKFQVKIPIVCILTGKYYS